MKALIQLLIVALIFNAGFQAARSYYGYHQFKHDVHQKTLSGGETATGELHQHILDMAAERGYVMTWNDVVVNRRGDLIVVDMKYVDNVSFIPRLYARPWAYEGQVQVRRVKSPAEQLLPP